MDLDAGGGTGVDVVHVWAYPIGACGERQSAGAAVRGERCATPQFVGAAAYGGIRPDVGAVLGDRFTESGYGIVADGLAPGTYDLAVFGWSTALGRFAPASVVRVTVR